MSMMCPIRRMSAPVLVATLVIFGGCAVKQHQSFDQMQVAWNARVNAICGNEKELEHTLWAGLSGQALIAAENSYLGCVSRVVNTLEEEQEKADSAHYSAPMPIAPTPTPIYMEPMYHAPTQGTVGEPTIRTLPAPDRQRPTIPTAPLPGGKVSCDRPLPPPSCPSESYPAPPPAT